MTNILSKLARLFTNENEASAAKAAFPNVHHGTPTFTPNNHLERLLVSAATDPEARPAFNRELLNADLFVATPNTPKETGHRVLEKDEVLQIMNVGSADGLTLPAVFSSEQRLAECFGAGTAFVAIQGEILLGILQKDGAVLNPSSGYGVRWTADELAAILGRSVRRVVQKGTNLTLGEPAERPQQLIERLTDILDGDARIHEAWLALAHWPDTDEWTWFLDLRSNSSPDEITPQLADACRPEFRDGKAVDIVVKVPTESPGVGIRIKPHRNH